jgi:hypothetical protein
MHTYTQSGQVWTVGFELPAERGFRKWRAVKDFDNEADAACFAAFLNGGQPPIGVLKRAFPNFNY